MDEDTVSSMTRICPACGLASGLRRGLKNDFELLACSSCATVYTAHLPDPDQLLDYDAYYTSENLKIPEVIASRLDEIIATFAPYRKNNRLLDVGCGAGTFLEAAARAGWQALGVEVSRTAVEHVSRRGFEVFCGELENANYTDDQFDVVIASEVLEHVSHPRAMLKEIARVLRPGGLLWATTPHGRGISARILGLEWSIVCPPEHLQLFSVAGIKGLLSGAEFRNVELATHGTNPFEILHSLRSSTTGAPPVNGSAEGESFNRVESSYQLHEILSDSPLRKFFKSSDEQSAKCGTAGRHSKNSRRKVSLKRREFIVGASLRGRPV